MATVELTRVTNSATLRVESALLNAILAIPETKFWELVDIRLNRPKGLRRATNSLGEEYLEIIELNDKPSVLKRWTEERLIDDLFLELAGAQTTAVARNRISRKYQTISSHKYYNQALALRKWIPIARPVPEFIVNLSDLLTRVIAELRVLDDSYTLVKLAVGRIFENIDSKQYHQSIASQLKVRIES